MFNFVSYLIQSDNILNLFGDSSPPPAPTKSEPKTDNLLNLLEDLDLGGPASTSEWYLKIDRLYFAIHYKNT